MISVQALFRLLKIGISDAAALSKIHRIFVPQEYTKVDGIIDLVFETAEAAREDLGERLEASFDDAIDDDAQVANSEHSDTQRYLPRVGDEVKDACLRRVAQKIGAQLTQRSRSFSMDTSQSIGVMCAVSSQYRGGRYWFAFHDRHRVWLDECRLGYVVLGCGSSDSVLCIDYTWFKQYLRYLNASKSDRLYHHIHIDHIGANWSLKLKGRDQSVDVTRFLL